MRKTLPKGFVLIEITLTQGYVALIDDEDYELVSKYKWRALKCKNTVYARANTSRKLGKQRNIMLHRLIMNAKKGEEIDHVDRNGLNNQKANLRIGSHSQNMANQSSNRGSSRYKGVCWHKLDKKWQAKVGKIYIGKFDSEEEAAKAYDKKARELYGEFTRTNFP